jgi:hypothetical protein
MNTQSIQTQSATPAPQSCLRCGRVVTKREQHDELEERVLEAIRASRPDWADSDGGDSAPHVEHYRELLRLRKKRSERARAERLHARVRRQRVRARLRSLVRKCALLLTAGRADSSLNARDCAAGLGGEG